MTVSALMVMGSLVVVIDSVVVVDAAVASVAVLKMLRLMGRVRREEELVLVPAALLALAFWPPETLPIVRIICSARLPVTGRTRLLLLTGAVLTTGGVAVVVDPPPPPLMEAETAAAKASAVTLGVDFEEADSGGGVLVMVTVVFSGVTIVKVNGLVRSTVESVTTTEAVAGTCVELTTRVSVVDGTSVVVSEGVTSDRMLTTGSDADVVVVVGAAVVVERTLPEPNNLDPVSLTRPVPPSRLDSKLLTMVASEMVSGSSGPSVSSSSSLSGVVGAKVVVVVPASVVTDSTVVNGTVVPSVVKEKAMGENELRAKTDGLIGVLLRGGNRVVDVTGSVTTEKVVVGTDSAVVVSAASSATLGASVPISTVVGEIVVVVVGVVVLTRLRGKVGNKVDGFSVVVVVVVVTSSEPRNLVNSLESSLSCTTTTVGLMLSVSTAFNSLTAAVLDPPSLILRRNCGWRMTAVSSKSPASVMLSLALGLVRMMVLT